MLKFFWIVIGVILCNIYLRCQACIPVCILVHRWNWVSSRRSISITNSEKKLDTTYVFKFKTKMVISAEGSVFRKMINVKKTSWDIHLIYFTKYTIIVINVKCMALLYIKYTRSDYLNSLNLCPILFVNKICSTQLLQFMN